MKVKYCGPAKDYSGYGEANRHDIGALVAAGVEVTTELPMHCLEIGDFGRLGELATSLEGRPLGYKIKILHTTPNIYHKFIETGKYHIGRAFWETDKVPLQFASKLELMDEIWTGSKYNEAAMRKAGVTKPIFIIPEAIDADIDPESVKPYLTCVPNLFKFYSVFEWTERKNPTALLSAFWQEFEKEKGVCLILKTFVDNFTPERRKEVLNYVTRIKKKLNLSNYAPVYVYRNLMTRKEIYRFHRTMDCFVSAHRGEGWGIPQMEAMLMEKPVISTNCGGIHEYLTNGKNAFLVKCSLIPVRNVTKNIQWYTTDQRWAEVNIGDLRKAMRMVYDNRDMAAEVGRAGRQTVSKHFSLESVGLVMRNRLQAIQAKLASTGK